MIEVGQFRHHLPYRTQHPGEPRFWDGTDTLELFHQNCQDPVRRQMLEDYGWLDPSISITYRFNQHGFREEEFDDRPCGIALGCSFTDGIGVPKEHAWPSYLSDLTGIKVWNLGLGGSGSDTCFRVMDYWTPVLRPKFIVLLEPPEARLEVQMISGQFDSLLAWHWENNASASPRDVFLRHWFTQDFNSENHHRKNVMAMRYLAQHLNIPFFNYPHMMPQSCYINRHTGDFPLARDLGHSGSMCYQLFAELVYSDLLKNHVL
jgi:hypothetical protein